MSRTEAAGIATLRHHRAHATERFVAWSVRGLGVALLTVALVACGPDLDDSGRGGPPIVPVDSIVSADGPIWLGAPPAAVTVDDKVLADVARGVVGVRAHGCGPARHGSAFAVAPGLLVGAAHVVTGASSVEIAWDADGDGEHVTYPADIVAIDPARDLVLLRSDAMAPPLQIGRVRFGITGAVLGYPQGEGLAVSPARIETVVAASMDWSDGPARTVYLVAADVRRGQSGGPLIDRDGRALGVAFAASQGLGEIGFALSRSELLGFLAAAGVEAKADYLGDTVITAQPENLREVSSGECRIG